MKPSSRQPPAAGRRRPSQSRARQTSQALQDAFVRLLVEHGYAAITVREIVLVAGTGLGSFYEYFASKQDLARVCLHLRTKALLLGIRGVVASHAGQPLARIVEAVVDSQLQAHRERPEEWGAHYLLERHYSSAEAYRKMYERFVDAWAGAIESASDLPPGYPVRAAARVSQTILYGLFAHAHLGTPRPDPSALRIEACTAITAYLKAVMV
ncbi:TetR family transcriptional regulator [Comamonas phosphati]|nr:TetR family transcriptional regulator [Comamonas phosphati]